MTTPIEPPRPTPQEQFQAWLHLYDATWADIRHSRLQEWSALGIVSAGVTGLAALIATGVAPRAVGSLLALAMLVLSASGILVSLRHRELFIQKMVLLKETEARLGLNEIVQRVFANQHQERLPLWRLGSTFSFMLLIYAGFILATIVLLFWLL